MSMSDEQFQENMMKSFIQIAAVVILVTFCFSIVAPFVNMVVWAIIIAVALYPLHRILVEKLGGREKVSATILVLAMLALLLVPTFFLAESSLHATRDLVEDLRSGAIVIGPPDPSVAEWPFIGERVFTVWSDAARNIEATLNQFAPQLQAAGEFVARFAASTAVGLLVYIASIIVAGVFLVSGDSGYRVSKNLGLTMSPEHGKDIVDMSVATIRSVAKGVLGVAIIQALLSAVGLALMDVPAAGLWTFIILMLAIMQLPPLIILGPIVVWVFSVSDGLPATAFAIYAGIVSISDSFLKPMFLGRGMDIPMLVILIGAIGGAFTAGIIGLFIGAIVLAVGYKLLMAWMITEEEEHEAAPLAEGAAE